MTCSEIIPCTRVTSRSARLKRNEPASLSERRIHAAVAATGLRGKIYRRAQKGTDRIMAGRSMGILQELRGSLGKDEFHRPIYRIPVASLPRLVLVAVLRGSLCRG